MWVKPHHLGETVKKLSSRAIAALTNGVLVLVLAVLGCVCFLPSAAHVSSDLEERVLRRGAEGVDDGIGLDLADLALEFDHHAAVDYLERGGVGADGHAGLGDALAVGQGVSGGYALHYLRAAADERHVVAVLGQPERGLAAYESDAEHYDLVADLDLAVEDVGGVHAFGDASVVSEENIRDVYNVSARVCRVDGIPVVVPVC